MFGPAQWRGDFALGMVSGRKNSPAHLAHGGRLRIGRIKHSLWQDWCEMLDLQKRGASAAGGYAAATTATRADRSLRRKFMAIASSSSVAASLWDARASHSEAATARPVAKKRQFMAMMPKRGKYR